MRSIIRSKRMLTLAWFVYLYCLHQNFSLQTFEENFKKISLFKTNDFMAIKFKKSLLLYL